MKKYCISLRRSEDRRLKFKKDWIDDLGFDIEFFDAIDKNDISTKDIIKCKKKLDALPFSPYCLFSGKYSIPGIMACSLSHLKLLKQLENNLDDDGVVIMEDDVIPLEGAVELEDRIRLARKYNPNVESIVCFGFVEPRKIYGLQLINEAASGKGVTWDESICTKTILESKSSIVLIPPPGTFFNWYSKKGVSRMIKLIEGKEYMSIDIFYTGFALSGTLSMLNPGIGYHPPIDNIQNTSLITSFPYSYFKKIN